MLSREENEVLTRVGPGTLMGNLLRRFWIPALVASELPSPDCDPVRVRLLGENLVAFRDTAGQVGVLDEYCAHRGASLALGRCEEGGIRCVYHGWKFAADGAVLDVMNHRDPTIIKRNVRARAYPVAEKADLIWVYMGPPDKQPPLPNYRFMEAPAENRGITKTILPANWVQIMEGHLDSSHAGILHRDNSLFKREIKEERTHILRGAEDYLSDDDAPVLEIEDIEVGFHAAAIRESVQEGMNYVRVHTHVNPFLNLVPPVGHTFDIPIDDYNTIFLYIGYDPNRRFDNRTRQDLLMSGRYFKDGRYIGTAENRWGQDRSTMNTSWTGIDNQGAEDWAVCASMGPIYDRSKEHLIPADLAVIRMRRQLLELARDLEKGIEPRGPWADTSTTQAGDGLLKVGEPWQKLVPGSTRRYTSDRVPDQEPEPSTVF
jgi:phthalate 4,5-dioxygenase